MRQPHHGRGGSRHCGRLRHAAAAILSKGLGWLIMAHEIKPITGAWRTNKHFDIYRWELFTYDHGNQNLPYIAGCWESLTDFVRLAKRHGFHVSDDVIYPGPDK